MCELCCGQDDSVEDGGDQEGTDLAPQETARLRARLHTLLMVPHDY